MNAVVRTLAVRPPLALDERIAKILDAPPTKLAAIDAILVGDEGSSGEVSNEGPLLLGMGEAAQVLGVSRATLWRLTKSGRLPKIEILPNSYRIRRSDILNLIGKPDRKGEMI